MRLAACVVAALVLAACGKERATESVSAPATCTRCHGGGDNATGAPPLDGQGRSDTTVRSVGAHSAHVGAGRVLAPLGCEACHVAPGPEAPLAHVDGETRVDLGIAARTNGYAASWDTGTASCDVYCHGPTLHGGSTPRPVWTAVRPKDSPADCGACHGAPPPLPHPARSDCGTCHAGTIRAGTDREIDVARGLHLNGVIEKPTGCTACHGDPGRARDAAAPPAGTHGETLPSERGVGAHQAHLAGGAIARAIACTECHVLPQSMAHADGVVDLAFGPTARARSAAPRFDAATGTCASTYCHGATLAPGGSNRTPSWTGGPSQVACGTCHGAPPPSHAAGATRCEVCHPGTVLPGGGIDVNGGMHVNGTLEVTQYHPDGWYQPTVHGLAANRDLADCRRCHGADLGGGIALSCALCHGERWQSNCTFCHGDPNRATHAAAPPEGTQNELATTEPAVGAHQAHLRDGEIRQAVQCDECHAVPTDLSHVTGTPELTWGDLARARGASPRFEGGTCAATYCHGATLGAGGTNQAPAWTVVDGTQAACGTCHGNPPPLPHAQVAGCRPCHPQTIDASGAIDVAGGAHLNGQLDRSNTHPTGWRDPAQHGYAANRDLAGCKSCHGADLAGGTVGVSCSACHQPGWQTSCTFCHGEAGRAIAPAAPPVGTQGEALTTDRAVGAHQRHVQGGALSPPVACGECHVTPTDLAHVNGTPALTWGPLARAHSAAPAFGGATCSGVYCHGATLAAGGTNTAPAWAVVDGTQAACGTCHGAPPPYPHPQNTSCGTCHPGAGVGAPNRDTHVNGTLELSAMACSSCHGDATRPVAPAAPPVGTRGETATTARAVGAHQSHVQQGALARAFDCDECHLKPADLTHIDGTPAIVFGTLGGGASGGWNGATCATYCHGATLQAGGSHTTPTWTRVGAGEASCGSCHGAPPPAPHPSNSSCGSCHAGYTQSSVNLDTHVDGKLDLSGTLSCSSCHGDATRALAPAAPPLGTAGETAPSERAVGAHQAHLAGSPRAEPVACTECHAVPASMTHANGVVDLRFGAIATHGATVTPSWTGATCTNYCHGATLAGGSNTAPSWTGGPTQAACGTCHGAPPRYPHPQNTSCGTCHPGAGVGAANRATHVDGTLDLSAMGCSSCHGDATRPVAPAAPPVGTHGETATTERAVGAHQSHVQQGALARAFDCDECHRLPTDLTHIDGTPAIVFGALSGTAASWNGATCATYCHGATLQAGGSHTTPTWTRVGAGEASCGSCHGAPPPAPHPSNSNCAACHSGYTQTSVNLDTHVDGKLDLSGTLSCTSCHGDASRTVAPAAPPLGTRGETAPTERAVGAHQAHLGGTSLAAPVACTECHAVPTSLAHASGAVELKFGALATRGGTVTPSWTGTTCSNYCHGASLAGGSNTAPLWTGGGSQATCGTCHGLPPPAPHPAVSSNLTGCTNCHGNTVDAAGQLVPAASGGKHLNGTVDAGSLEAGCASCHGLPPSDGGSSGHAFHVFTQKVDCGGCHSGYSRTVADPATHMNGTRDVRVTYPTPNPDPGFGVPPTLEACLAPPLQATAVIPQSTNPTTWDPNVCTSCHTVRDYRYNACCANDGAPNPEWCMDYW